MACSTLLILLVLIVSSGEPGAGLQSPNPSTGITEPKPPATITDDAVEARDPWQIQFIGLDVFTLKSIRTALIHDAELKDARRSDVTDDEFTSMLKGKLLSGLRICRYAEATLNVERSVDGQFTVRAECGPEYGWAPVRIEAAPEFDVTTIARYHELWRDEKFRRKSPLSKWIPGVASSASETESKSIVDFTNEIAKKDLRENFRCSVRFDYDAAAKQITPVVIVDEPGYHTLISEVIFDGHSANSEAELRTFTGTLDGSRFTGKMQQSLLQKFVSSGRFVHTSIMADAPFAPDHAVPVRISIRENPGVPPLPEPLPDFDQALVRLAQWLSNWSSGDGDLQLSSLGSKAELDAAAATAESLVHESTDVAGKFNVLRALGWDDAVSGQATMTLSAEKGFLIAVRTVDGKALVSSDMSVMFTVDTIGFADSAMNHRWTRSWDFATVTGHIGFQGLPANNENNYHLTFDGGIRGAEKSPLQVALVVEPAALHLQIHEVMGEASPVLKDGFWVVETDAFSLRFHAETGRLDYLQSKADHHTVKLVCGPALLQDEVDRIYAGASKNLWQPGRDLTGLLQFLLPYIHRGITDPDEQQFEFIARVVAENTPLDRLLNSVIVEGGQRGFVLPSGTESRRISQDSPPWYLAWIASSIEGTPAERLLALFDANRNDDTLRGEFLAELRRRDEAGPACCLLLAYCFNAVKADIARVGLDRLDFDHFVRDIEPLLEEHSQISEALSETYAIVRSFTDDECELLAILMDNANKELARLANRPISSVSIRPILAIIRVNAGDDTETTRTLLRLAWDVVLRDLVKAKLTELIAAPPSDLAIHPASFSVGVGRLLQNADLEKAKSTSTSENAPSSLSRKEQIRLDASDPTKILDSVKPFNDGDEGSSQDE